MGGGGAAAKPKKSVEIIVVGRGEGYSDSWIPIFDAWVFEEDGNRTYYNLLTTDLQPFDH